jgi:hypothetical protein
MFARNVSIRLKPNMLSDYARTFEKEVLPLLRKQKGFKDEITFADGNGVDVTAISLWENKTDAEAYSTNTYPQVLKTMARFIEGTPRLQSGEVLNSTFHKIEAAVAA